MNTPQLPDRRPLPAIRPYPARDDGTWPRATPTVPTLVLGIVVVLAGFAVLPLARGLGFGELVGAVGAALGDALRQLLLVGVLVVLVLVAAPLLIVGVLVFAIAHLLAGCGCCDEHHGHHRCGPYFVYPFGIGPYGGHHHRGHHHHGGHHHRGHHHRGGF